MRCQNGLRNIRIHGSQFVRGGSAEKGRARAQCQFFQEGAVYRVTQPDGIDAHVVLQRQFKRRATIRRTLPAIFRAIPNQNHNTVGRIAVHSGLHGFQRTIV